MGFLGSTVVVTIVIFSAFTDGIQWLGLSNSSLEWSKKSSCVQAAKRNYLLKVQKKACKLHLEKMPVLSHVAGQAIEVCGEVFADSRWNCSSIRKVPDFGSDITRGTKERAYAYSLSSAAIVYGVAKACSEGTLTSCSCGKKSKEPPPGDFKWGGCADNVKYGVVMAKTFTEKPFRRRKFRRNVGVRMDRHNSRAGWRNAHGSITLHCKCHGVSGSCNLKTCWRALPPLKELATKLKRKYIEAEAVENKRVAGGTRWKLLPISATARFNKDDLIYLEKSPDYCDPDSNLGSYGTQGRSCNESSTGSDSCENMCCGRGHTTVWTVTKEHCRCKYHWCCYVTCDTCEVRRSYQQCL